MITESPRDDPANGSNAVILIHGAWQGSWAWDLVVPKLKKQGLNPIAIDLPGNGFNDSVALQDVSLHSYLDCIEDIIGQLEGKVSLVGHSGGGQIMTAAADRFADRIDRLIYVAGFALPNGQNFGQVQEIIAGEGGLGNVFGVTPFVKPSSDGVSSVVPAEAAVSYFYQDCPVEMATQAAHNLTPQPNGGRNLDWTVQSPYFKSIPKLYIEALKDQSVLIEAQRLMQSYLGEDLKVVSIDTGHAPQLADPERLAAIMVAFLR
jgi:pimeloyl-ACP methyl ester carboxylesterase